MKRASYIGVVLVVLGIGYRVFTGPAGTTCADLIAEGTASADCHAGMVTCSSHTSAELAQRLASLGLPLPRPNQRFGIATTAALIWGGDDAGVAPGFFASTLAAMGVIDATGQVLEVVNRDRCLLRPCDALCLAPIPIRWEDGGMPCVRAPVDDDAGTCLRRDPATGMPHYFGAGTVFEVELMVGSGCEPIAAGCGAFTFAAGLESGL